MRHNYIHHTVYKITNNLNGKFYIGKHQTNLLDDGYMGSGKLIKLAIKKHGLKNFTKEILAIFDNEEEMNLKEAELVIVGENTYNLCGGGKGGFGFINQTKPNEIQRREKLSKSKKGVKTNYQPGLDAAVKAVKGKTYDQIFSDSDTVSQRKSINSNYMKSNNPNEIKVECPHCFKIGAKPPMKRFHFEKCKSRFTNSEKGQYHENQHLQYSENGFPKSPDVC